MGSYPKRKAGFDWEMCKDVADIPENPVQIFYYRQSIRGLFVKKRRFKTFQNALFPNI